MFDKNADLEQLDLIPAQIWRSRADGFMVYANKHWLDYTGVAFGKASGWQWLEAIHSDDLVPFQAVWEGLMACGMRGGAEARIRRFDGVYRWFLLTAEPARDESGAVVSWCGTNTDIDDRKQTEKMLRDSERNLRQIRETIPEMLWSATSDGAIDYCNVRLLDYTGLSVREVRGDAWTRLLHPNDVEQARQSWLSCTTAIQPYRIEVRTRHASDSTYRWCVVSALPLLDEAGKVQKWHGTVVDLQDWKESQDELRNIQAEFAHLTRKLTMGQLAASIAHEVNQPLASIVTNGETSLRLLDRVPSDAEKNRELTRRMVADARRAADIIERIRALVTGGEAKLVRNSLSDVIEESMAFLRPELQSKNVNVSLNLSREPEIIGDRTQLHQVIVNIVANAVNAISEYGGRISIQTRLTTSEIVRCDIEDSGPGIDPAIIPRLFDSFFTTKEAGMGMGLSIARSIIESHGGQIWAENNSQLGGARFSFELLANVAS